MPYSFNPLSSLGLDQSIPLDSAGKIPSGYLPSYVDDVEEYADLASFPATGETGKIYVAIDTGFTYRWSGSAYVRINSLDSITGDVNVAADGTSSIASGVIVDADVNASAAIAGTKIDPDFGSQTIETTGDLAINTDVLFVDSSESAVGIGTTSPSGKLTVDTETAATNAVLIAASNETGRSYGLGVNASASFVIHEHIAASDRLVIDSSGRLLVGTSSARTGFQISTGFGNVTPVHQFEFNSQTYNGVSITHNAGDNVYPAVLAFGKSRGSSAGSYTAVVSGDRLGWLDFYGADGTNMVRAANISAEVDGTPAANDMPGRLVFSTTADGAASPTERMRITSAGNVYQYSNQYNFDSSSATIEYVNRNSGGAKEFRWYVGADGSTPLATLSTAGVWTDASDISNKTNITDSGYGIDAVKALRPREYDVISDGTHAVGFVAQEVRSVVPEVVNASATQDGSEILGLSYGQLTAVLTKALQETLAKVETLEAKVAALEAS